MLLYLLLALILAKDAKTNPKQLADKIKSEIEKLKHGFVEKIEVAGPGFINFFLSRQSSKRLRMRETLFLRTFSETFRRFANS